MTFGIRDVENFFKACMPRVPSSSRFQAVFLDGEIFMVKHGDLKSTNIGNKYPWEFINHEKKTRENP